MKIGGRIIDGPKQILLVLPRGDQGDIPFKFIAVLDTADFDRMCRPPQPPVSIKVGVGRVENVEDKGYKAALERHGELRADWFFLQSIRPSEIEWDRVKMEDPSTWKYWRQEFRDAGFSVAETNKLWDAFLECNTVSEGMVQEARLRFLHGLAETALEKTQSLISEQANTESGEPASAGESAPPG